MSTDHEKTLAARTAAEFIEDGMLVGLGTGSTSAKLVHAIGRKLRAGKIHIEGVCTSWSTEELAREYNIPILEMVQEREIDLYVDGADEIDDDGNMIKGGGGALLREKLVASHSRRRVIMVDSTKPVKRLGVAFNLPVEIVKFAHTTIIERVTREAGCDAQLRLVKGKPFVTDEGHYIVDCNFPDGISDAPEMDRLLNSLPGVVETGLFIGLCDLLVMGRGEEVIQKEFPRR